MSISDPNICYILDGLLLLYSIVMTALFFRAKVSTGGPQPSSPGIRGGPEIYKDVEGGQCVSVQIGMLYM